jgi:heavy metal translocating P-type ATPase
MEDTDRAAAGDGLPPRPSVGRRFVGSAETYPIPYLALGGLLVGLALEFAYHRPDLGSLAWLLTVVLGGIPLVAATVRRLLRREFASDIIASVAILAAIALDQPFAGVIIVLMQSGGEAIEQFAHRHATASLERLTQRAPRWAFRYRGSELDRIPVEEVRPGDRLAVRSGDVIPVDGRIAGPSALLDESAVTGEPLPRTKGSGATALSGTVNVGAAFDLEAIRPSRESQYARIVDLVRTAQTRKPAIQRLADRYATWFTPTTLVIALLAGIFDHDPVTGLAVLVVATPCPLILATPIAVLRGMDRASADGVIAKSGAALEEMSRAQVVLFDKTGTLTAGQPEVERVVAFGEWPEAEVLRVAGALERFSSHPIAQAVLRRAGALAPLGAAQPREFPGSGISGSVDGHPVVVGSSGLCAGFAGRPLTAEMQAVASAGPTQGRLIAFVVRDGVPIGALLFADPVRPEVPGLAGTLRALGVAHVGLLTGDNRGNAEEVAEVAGITEVEAELLPEQKVARVGEFRRKYGSTIMVGDGINDAAALATASVGIAMGARGAGVTSEAADVVLLVDDLGRVADGVRLGQRMMRIARQGILVGLGTSLVLMGIASFGLIPPAEGAIVQEALDAAVILNALRV